jgi:CheY-like chemotaxis protein
MYREGNNAMTRAMYPIVPTDVVLLDLAMPDINGIEVARIMSGLDRNVPIILFTILDLEGIEKAARSAGIRAIVSKGECWNLLGSIETAIAGSQGPTRPS